MDTITNVINNNYNLWSEDLKRERTINKIKQPGFIKTINNESDQQHKRVIRSFYTGIPDGISINGHDTGTMLTSSRIEHM